MSLSILPAAKFFVLHGFSHGHDPQAFKKESCRNGRAKALGWSVGDRSQADRIVEWRCRNPTCNLLAQGNRENWPGRKRGTDADLPQRCTQYDPAGFMGRLGHLFGHGQSSERPASGRAGSGPKWRRHAWGGSASLKLAGTPCANFQRRCTQNHCPG